MLESLHKLRMVADPQEFHEPEPRESQAPALAVGLSPSEINDVDDPTNPVHNCFLCGDLTWEDEGRRGADVFACYRCLRLRPTLFQERWAFLWSRGGC